MAATGGPFSIGLSSAHTERSRAIAKSQYPADTLFGMSRGSSFAVLCSLSAYVFVINFLVPMTVALANALARR